MSEATNEGLVAGVRGGRLHAAVVFEDAARTPRELDGLRRDDLFTEPLVAAVPAATAWPAAAGSRWPTSPASRGPRRPRRPGRAGVPGGGAM